MSKPRATRRAAFPGWIETRGKHGDLLRWCCRIGGKRVSHTFAPGTAREDAERFARKEYDKLFARAASGQRDVAVAELVESYRQERVPTLADGTAKSYGASLDYFVRFIESRALDRTPVHKVGRPVIESFLSWLRANPQRGGTPSPHTVAKHFRVVKALFSYAESMEWTDRNPCRHVKPPKGDAKDVVLLSPAELAELLDAAPCDMARAYLATVAETGGRAFSEILHLRWEDVHLSGLGDIRSPHITLRTAGRWVRAEGGGRRNKNGEPRLVPITTALEPILREHAARYMLSGSPWVFHYTEPGRHGHTVGAVWKESKARSVAERARDAAGIPKGWSLHHLRHGFATSWLAKGANPVHVKEALGHSTLAVTMGYTHLAGAHLSTFTSSDPAPEPTPEERKTG